jgi:branched-chain amino acid aminotransferase
MTGYCFSNGQFVDSGLFREETYSNGLSVYEVIRVMDHKCLFLEEHLQRMAASLQLLRISYNLDYNYIKYILHDLVLRNSLHEGNIKLVINFKIPLSGRIYCHIIPHFYPTPAMFEKGVFTRLIRESRVEPNIKRLADDQQLKIMNFIETNHVFEAILYNDRENITEGSKSNVFFIRGTEILTAPDEFVLKGVTRKKIIEICNINDYNLVKRLISINDLNKMDAAFLTGTSPKVLPICRIDEIVFAVENKLLRKIMREYDNMISDYLAGNAPEDCRLQ